MREITLGNKKEVSALKVNIGKDTYSIPLTGSFTIAEMEKIKDEIKDDKEGYAFFAKYIPLDILKSLTISEFKELTEAWKSASEEESGIGLGE